MAPNPFINYLFNLSDECTSLALALREILAQERAALIGLNTDNILLLVSQKESLMLKLQRKRAELKNFARTQFQIEDLGQWHSGDEAVLAAWKLKSEEWNAVWESVRSDCDSNQKFIKHSMRNLGLLVENLKRLFGQHATYSAQGKRIEQNSSGKVVEAKY